MSHDYQMILKEHDGSQQEVSYQKLIRVLQIENEPVQGLPLREGGTPQVAVIAQMLTKKWNLKACEVHFNGSQIL